MKFECLQVLKGLASKMDGNHCLNWLRFYWSYHFE